MQAGKQSRQRRITEELVVVQPKVLQVGQLAELFRNGAGEGVAL